MQVTKFFILLLRIMIIYSEDHFPVIIIIKFDCRLIMSTYQVSEGPTLLSL